MRLLLLAPGHAIALAILSGAAAMLGVFLDTAWHRTIGRDSFFIPPHLFVYGGAAGIGFAALGAIARATLVAPAEFGGWMLRAGRLRLPFGFALAAAGILVVVAAVPVDQWWHSTFGKDVLIWSPPHIQLVFGAGVTALGLLFAIAAQRGRAWLARSWPWHLAMLAVCVDLLHKTHFVLAHYTMIPETRTPDLYPFLAALLTPAIMVATAASIGSWAPPAAGTLFLLLSLLMDLVLRLIDFDRYTLTPVLALPALAVTGARLAAGRRREQAWVALAAGALFALVFTGMEALWMARAVGRPWPWDRVAVGLPRSLLVGALSGWVGWVLGGFLSATKTAAPVAGVFGGARRARMAALTAAALIVAGLVSTYQPQRYGPPMSVGELRIGPLATFKIQDALFWEVLLEDRGDSPRIAAYSEGVIDGFPLPIGPARCAATGDALAADLARTAFRMEINGTPLDLGAYPLVRTRDRQGTHCAWVGVASRFQRASRNRFVYAVETAPASGAGPPRRITVEMEVVFKDP